MIIILSAYFDFVVKIMIKFLYICENIRNLKIFLQQVENQNGQKKLLSLKKSKILYHGQM